MRAFVEGSEHLEFSAEPPGRIARKPNRPYVIGVTLRPFDQPDGHILPVANGWLRATAEMWRAEGKTIAQRMGSRAALPRKAGELSAFLERGCEERDPQLPITFWVVPRGDASVLAAVARSNEKPMDGPRFDFAINRGAIWVSIMDRFIDLICPARDGASVIAQLRASARASSAPVVWNLW